MGILHCAAQNSHVNVMNFIFESLENLNVNEIEKVCGVIPKYQRVEQNPTRKSLKQRGKIDTPNTQMGDRLPSPGLVCRHFNTNYEAKLIHTVFGGTIPVSKYVETFPPFIFIRLALIII
jgi:hypothetical protein